MESGDVSMDLRLGIEQRLKWQLGFPGVVTALKYSPFGEGSGPVLMSYVSCTGSEKTLQQCQYRGWLESNVWEGREAGVICKTHELDTDVRGKYLN